jgi:hypothetical protein
MSLRDAKVYEPYTRNAQAGPLAGGAPADRKRAVERPGLGGGGSRLSTGSVLPLNSETRTLP